MNPMYAAFFNITGCTLPAGRMRNVEYMAFIAKMRAKYVKETGATPAANLSAWANWVDAQNPNKQRRLIA